MVDLPPGTKSVRPEGKGWIVMETTVVIIGGGATGTGILRDLSMRGIPAILFEQGGLCHGTSSRFHGLLHSGGRYAVSDSEAAAECIRENTILRSIGRQCIHETGGLFVLTEDDDPAYVDQWVKGCAAAGISARELDPAEALRLEPALNPHLKRVFHVPDAAVDGFRLVLHNAMSAQRYGGQFCTYHEVLGIATANGRVTGVDVVDQQTGQARRVHCRIVINAAGSWSGRVAALAGLHVPVTPDKGTLIVFNHRCTSHVVNRLHKSSDGDIFVPNGSVTILGTTSQTVDDPGDFHATTGEALRLLDLGRPLFPRIDRFRILRVFAGTRPLYTPGTAAGRSASRGFHISDHAEEGLEGLYTIFGGKLTTYRLMAEKMADMVAERLNVTVPCRTAEEALIPEVSQELREQAARIFAVQGLDLVADRLGDDFASCVADNAGRKRAANPLLCECEMVSAAELLHVARQPSTHSLNDLRLRTRLGMGTCQGTFCALRAASFLVEQGICLGKDPLSDMRNFVQERWKGTRPVFWGQLAREMEFARNLYAGTLGTEPGTVSVPEVRVETRARQNSQTGRVRTSRVADLVVVGAGLSGLWAACVAARAGRRVCVLTRGAGSLHIGSATIDVLGMTGAGQVLGDPLAHIARLPARHPYVLLGRRKVGAALASFASFCTRAGFPLYGAGGEDVLHNSLLPTALGTSKISCLYPESLNPAPLTRARRIVVCGIEGLRDCMPGMAVYNLRRRPEFADRMITASWLPSPWPGGTRTQTALDVARTLESAPCREFYTALGRVATGAEVVLVPPIAGTRPDSTVLHRLSKAAGCPVVEMTGLPPGVTGMRLGRLLLDELRRAGVPVLENATVTGCEIEGQRLQAVRTSHEDGERRYVADHFIIATGGMVSGGLVLQPGVAREPILGLECATPGETETWTAANPFASQPVAYLGVPVLPTLEPSLDGEEPLLRNVRYAGRMLAGCDTAFERSGNGLALATASAAALEPWL